MRRHNKRGYFSPTTIMALLLAVLALGLPFIMNGPVNDEDILTPLPTPESTVTTITEDTKIAAVPTQKPVAVTTKKRTDVSPKPSVTSSGTAPAAVVSSETVKSVQDKAINLEKVALGLYRDNGENITADALREKAGVLESYSRPKELTRSMVETFIDHIVICSSSDGTSKQEIKIYWNF